MAASWSNKSPRGTDHTTVPRKVKGQAGEDPPEPIPKRLVPPYSAGGVPPSLADLSITWRTRLTPNQMPATTGTKAIATTS